MINVMLSGCNGKMGSVLSGLLANDTQANVVCGFDINTASDKGYPVYDNLENVKEKVDVIIDFSHPNSLDAIINYCKSNNVPVVVATTGLSGEQKNDVSNLSKDVPVFFTFNMSLGINLLVNLVKKATSILEDNFDVEIIEKHHNQKIDAPSGTAIMIADAIKDTMKENAELVYDRHCVRKKREKNEIGMHAIRGGTIVGEHSVIFAGKDEVLELKHEAHSKEVFAVGAIKAAKFLIGKGAGMYDMSDLIEEK